ncbi:hypothetical protein [Streptacidiphilus fuscans]|uniref:Uncharacterized protein n=1 Tax=Streptacidiphilus fuscans TaxID=2789292 RepID=A0A931FD20_9ACTN|nr:hypothetical protein [Streptacidiphilus fuscans]MBF9067086.1 hypothetical protein [Streptacidiphilus fuscans]
MIHAEPTHTQPARERRPLDPSLTALLRTGPFPEALRAAVADSGLSLDRIRARLQLRGHRISVATLSCWQSGRYQPERAGSLRALASLEEILGLPSESLTALVGPPRPRGRRLPRPTDGRGLAATWPGAAGPVSALNEMDVRWDENLTRLSSHTRLELDSLGRERAMRSRQLLRAECDGPDRWITLFQREEPGPAPHLRVGAPCRAGKVLQNDETGMLAAEILFDRPLSRGDTVMIEYTIEHRTPRPFSTMMQSSLHVPVREYVMEVRFDPEALPLSCYSIRTAAPGSRPQERLLNPDTTGSVLTVALSAGPCSLGIRWDWEAR